MDVNGTVPSDRNPFVSGHVLNERGGWEQGRGWWWLCRLDLDSGEGAEADFGGAPPSREPVVNGPGVGGTLGLDPVLAWTKSSF